MSDQNSYDLEQIEDWIFRNSDIGNVQEKALAIAQSSGIDGLEDGPADAYRHMIVIGELTRRFGPTFGRIAGNAHEMARPGADAATAMDHHNNAVGIEIGKNAETWDDVIRMAREKVGETVEQGNSSSAKDRPYWIGQHPVDTWESDWKTRDIPPIEGGGVDGRYPFNDPDAEEDVNNGDESAEAGGRGDFATVKSFLQSPGDDEDEALLKDDLTEDEVRRVMLSNAYNDNRDPRFKAINDRIAWWFEDRWGDGDAGVDATGRMIQADRPETPAPARPLAASVASSGVDLGREIGRVVDAVFGNNQPVTPAEARVQSNGNLDSRIHGNDTVGAAASPVLSLQKALNRDEVRHGIAVLEDPLKLDGVAGPKTRRALRQAVAGFGADGLLARL